MSADSNQEVAIFTEVLGLPSEERAAFLDRVCGGDERLREKVTALLKANERIGGFLAEPPSGVAPEGIHAALNLEKAGDCIGHYKLLQKIGEGGCGIVFMAEQDYPVRRRVALKIVKPGMDTRSVVARFEAERQALALMDHSHIAHVLDAGATHTGRPFFVMELVRGIKITDYCDQHSLTTCQRLDLFVKVCDAVQHAHQKGIIHRDIKPSNVLVATDPDGRPFPKIIDFGIAKATTNQPLTDKTLFTAFEMLIGTPAYMSPEQATLTSVDVDTRTDIYSLGVLLYELLTGTTPFDSTELLKRGIDEVRRVIGTQEPVKPSTRLHTMLATTLTTVSKNQRAEPSRLISDIRGDLDWIVMKALEKDRARRYATANGLAMDVKRYLANETVLARPPSQVYKFRKLLVRNKVVFAGVGVIAAIFVASLIVVSISLAKERQARREAQVEQTKAEVAQQKSELGESKARTEAAKSRMITEFLKEMLHSVDPAVARGKDTALLHEVLDNTALRLGSEMSGQPEVEAELRSLLGGVYMEIGDYDRAETMQRAALAINQKLHGPQSPETATSLNQLGMVLMTHGKWSDAGFVYEEALAIRRRVNSTNAETAESLNNLAEIYTQLGRIDEAEPLCREALAIRQGLFTAHSLEAAQSLRDLGIILADKGQWDKADEIEREALSIRTSLLKPDDPHLALSLADVAWAAGGAGKLDEAEKFERQALDLRRRLLRENHPDIAKSLYLVGDRLRQRGKLADAYPYLTNALDMQRKIFPEDNPNLLDTMRSLAQLLEGDGKLAESEQMHRLALAMWRKRGEIDAPQGLTELYGLAHVLMIQKRFGDAEQVLDETLAPEMIRTPLSGSVLTLKADVEARNGQWEKAAADAWLAFENQPLDSGRYAMVAALLIKTRNLARYHELCRRTFDSYSNTTNIFTADQVAKAALFVPSSGSDLDTLAHLADIAVTLGANNDGAMPYFSICKALAEYRLGHFSGAAEWAQKAVDSDRPEAVEHACGILAMAWWQLGRKHEARTMFAKGQTLAPEIMPSSVAQDEGNRWLGWLYARIQLEEASSIIRSP
jgi:serine/threonine protein kinase/tetratricopeptide (TPR) repeat protein